MPAMMTTYMKDELNFLRQSSSPFLKSAQKPVGVPRVQFRSLCETDSVTNDALKEVNGAIAAP